MLYNFEGNYYWIMVCIVDFDGIVRWLIVYICGWILDFLRIYESYLIFKCELNVVLRSYVWVMDFV